MTVELTQIKEDFDTFGLNLEEDELLKCYELCTEYKLSGEDLAALWIGYAANHSLNDVTKEYLENLEQDELAKKRKKKTIQPVEKYPVLDSSSLPSHLDSGYDDLLVAYGASPSASHKTARRENTPDTSIAKRLGSQSVRQVPSQLSLTPEVSTPSQKYSSRSNSGQVVASYGSEAISSNFEASSYTPKVSWLSNDGSNVIKEPYMYMFEKVRDSAMILDDKINILADQIKQQLNIEEWMSFKEASNESVYTVGSICCDSVGRMNAASVLLESSREVSGGATISLDLSKLQQYSLFPGQTVAVKGINSNGDKLFVEDVKQGVALPLPDTKLDIKEGGIQIMVASGPFTTSENILYEPLEDLLREVKKNPPHILILIGPLLDVNHSHVVNNSLQDTFNNIETHCINVINSAIDETKTQLLIVSSSRDVCAQPIYPTPPFNYSGNAIWLSDPSIIEIDGVMIALTSTDVLLHLGKEEISFPPQSSDRLSRLSKHLLSQQSLYPLYPSPEGMAIDLEKVDTHARLSCTPHVIILPSDLRYFIKEVEGCVIVNPERMAKGAGGGSYARLEIKQCSNKSGTIKDSINAVVRKI